MQAEVKAQSDTLEENVSDTIVILDFKMYSFVILITCGQSYDM